MNDRPRARKGHGALTNPPPRFDLHQLSAVDDGWYQEESPERIPTTLEPDRARGVITTNDSPDIPFEQSINPYRGCAHACPYCMSGDTPILMGDGRIRPLAQLRVGDQVYGTRRVGRHRRYVLSRVLAHWSAIKRAFQTTLEDGTTLVTSGDHRFLSNRGWKFVTGREHGRHRRPHLTCLNKLVGTGMFARSVAQDEEYRRGYLCGMVRGDAQLGIHNYRRGNGRPARIHQVRRALCDTEALVRARNYLMDFEVFSCGFEFQAAVGNHRAMHGIRTGSIANVQAIYRLAAWPPAPTTGWMAGFLAGIFDAEGSLSQGAFRISNTDAQIIGWIERCLRAFNFRFVVEHVHHEDHKPIDVVRVTGGLKEHLRFFHSVSPAITRKFDLAGRAVMSGEGLRVVSIEPLRAMRLYDITTETEDFIANGVVSHNCYARPSHAYMGLSPGIDFETRLFYKADAAKTLETELAQPSYVCKSITLGANTDPYQPVEKRMKVTRSILEVLAKTRHPVAVITKSALVVRDLDLLSDLARDNLASVALSVTTLDDELKRCLEPQAASPAARLRTIAALSAAGVPVGVMVAPVIPALTDHEMERILEACAAAGALWAGYTLLRLPYEVKDLFKEWLAEHYPERAAHVMSMIRDMREGRENDARFGSRMGGTGPLALLLRSRFKLACQRLKLNSTARGALDTTRFRPPGQAGAQLQLTW
ncbi:MAG TPA: PA0069 family radical SAM protein [Steroidobacteraceae bacterium]|jgi:DNA repair photolyase|nr:PA0069 family radical SAM protein [Steroidobacteraceae bacterium]